MFVHTNIICKKIQFKVYQGESLDHAHKKRRGCTDKEYNQGTIVKVTSKKLLTRFTPLLILEPTSV